MTMYPYSFAVVPPTAYQAGRASRYDGSTSSVNSFYDKEGVRQLAPIWWPRFDHNPATYAPLGWMNEAAATNLALYSNTFSNAAWLKTNSSVGSAADTIGADNLTSAWSYLLGLTNAVHGLRQSISTTASTSYVFAIDVKAVAASNVTHVQIAVDDTAGNGGYMTVRLSDGTITTSATAAGTGTSVAGGVITLAKNGFYRIWLTVKNSATTSRIGIYPLSTSAAGSGFIPTWTPSGTNLISVSCAQFEAGTTPTSYIPTTSASVLRGAEHYTYAGGYTSTSDALHSFCNLPMFRLNLLKYNEDLTQSGTWTRTNITGVTANATYSPLTYNANTVDEVIPDTSASADHSVKQAITIPYIINGSAVTHIVYAKQHAYSGLVVELDSGGTVGCRMAVDLTTGAFTTSTYGGSGTNFPIISTAKVEAVTSVNDGSTFYRITLVGWITDTTGHTVKYKVFADYTAAQALTSYSGTGTSGIYLWGAQAYEATPVYGGYTKTDGVGTDTSELSITSDVDPAKWVTGNVTAGQQVSAQTATADQAFGVYQADSSFSSSTSPELDTSNWTFVGPVNALRYMDDVNQTKTTAEGEIVIVFFSSAADTYVVDSVEADSVRLFVGDGSTYDRTVTLTTTLGVNKTTAVFTGVPTAASAVQIIISRTTATDTVRVGGVLRGNGLVCGKTQNGATVGIVDYSSNTTDTFGKRTVTQREYVKRMRASVVVDSSLVDAVQALLTDYRAQIAGYVAGTSYGSLAVIGFTKSWDETIANPTNSILAVEVEGNA